MSISSSRRRRLQYQRSGNKRILIENESDEEEQFNLINGAISVLYPRGTIKRIRLKNFMTFDDFAIDFDPKLNVVLAPNGAGKSSLVCGICLSLGGKPGLLGRQRHLSEFVKRGQTYGSLEIYISDNPGGSETAIKREFQSDRNTSTWFIDGCPSNGREVEGLMTEMKIQLNNLLQFMPQDRVSEFASLTPIQRLQETQRAIDPSLHELHRQLMDMAEYSTSTKETLQKLQKDLESAENRRRHLQNDVLRIQQVQQLKEQVEHCEAKLLVLNQREAQKARKTSQKRLINGKGNLTRAKNAHATIEAEHKTSTAQLGRSEKKLQELREKINNLSSWMDNAAAEMENTEEEIDGKIDRLTNLERESRRQQRTIQDLQTSIQEAEREAGEVETHHQEAQEQLNHQSEIVKGVTQKLVTMNASMNQIEEQYKNQDHQKRRIQESIQRLEQVKIQRVLALQRRRPRFRGLSEAFDALQRHRDEFKKPVFGPLVTEISVSDDRVSAFLEQQVSLAVWTFFIVQCEEDHRKLKSMNLLPDINIVEFSGSSEDYLVPVPVDGALRQQGVIGSLADLFEAHPVVKAIMNEESQLTRAFAGSEVAERFVQDIFRRHSEIQRLFTPHKCFTIKKSRYSNATSTSVSAVITPTLLGRALLSTEEKSELQDRLELLNKDILKICSELSQRKQVYIDTKTELHVYDQKKKEIQIKVKDLEKKLGSLQLRLNDLKRRLDHAINLPDPVESEQTIKEELEGLQDKWCLQSKGLAAKQRDQGQHIESNTCTLATHHHLQIKNSRARRAVRDTKERVLYQTQLVRDLEEIVEKDLETIECLKRELESKYPCSRQWKAQLDALPNSREDIEALIVEAKHSINVMTVSNPDALTTFEELGEQIEILKGRLEEAKTAAEDSTNQIEESKGNWLVRIKHAVCQINSAFSDNIEAIGCVGVVALVGEETHGSNFKDYAIDIKVKFRHGEPLKPLDSSRQSGGERACAIALYLLSLQTVAKIPFRVMDEINKGMDELNERRLLDLLSSSTSSGSFPQTLLFTPKTIPDCKAFENSTIIILQSGTFVNS